MDHLMVNFEITIALASMICIVEVGAYELHSGDEKLSTTLLMKDIVLHYMYDMIHYYSEIYLYICVND